LIIGLLEKSTAAIYHNWNDIVIAITAYSLWLWWMSHNHWIFNNSWQLYMDSAVDQLKKNWDSIFH